MWIANIVSKNSWVPSYEKRTNSVLGNIESLLCYSSKKSTNNVSAVT